MNVLSIFLLLIFVFGCATNKYEILKWDGASSAKIINLTKSDVESDLNVLIYALRKAYIGGDFIDKKVFDPFIHDIQKLSGIDYADNVEFCHKLAEQFHKLPDGHFNIWFPKHVCYQPRENTAQVGINYAVSKVKGKPFFLEEISNKGIAILAISHLPNFENATWDGFNEAIQKAKRYKRLIIDLRGNGGGDSRSGLLLARELLNSSISHSRKKIIRKNTAESWTIYHNSILRDKIWLESTGKDTKHLDLMIDKINGEIEKINFFTKPQLVSTFEAPKTEPLEFKGEIYILVDRLCGSSCEHTLEALKFHPNAKSVGKNTAGAIHYGQMGLIRLPKSGIYFNLATQYFDLFTEGYYEKIGYRPDHMVPDEIDALDYVLKMLDSKAKSQVEI